MQQRVIDQRLGSLEDVEDINILYRSSLIPSVLMLVYGLGALWLLRDNSQFAWLLGWFAVTDLFSGSAFYHSMCFCTTHDPGAVLSTMAVFVANWSLFVRLSIVCGAGVFFTRS